MQTKASIYSDGNPQMVKLFEQAGHPAKVMCVALDYAKAQHTALICNGQGDLLKGAFVVDNTPVGATHLLDQVRQCAQSKKIGPTQVFFGGEDCPYFAENSKIFKIAVLVVRYLQFRSNFRWAVSNLVALLR